MDIADRLTKIIEQAEQLQLEAVEALMSLKENLYDQLFIDGRIPVVGQHEGLYVQVKGFNYVTKEVIFAYATQPSNTLLNGNVASECWHQLLTLMSDINGRDAELWCLIRAAKVNYKWRWLEVACVADGPRMRGAAKRQHAEDPVRYKGRFS